MKTPLQTFGPNENGRDFIIGDLHGAYDAFLTLLEGVNFDTEKDRMFSVGDLVDRGTQSQECLRLMREPWFHCVLSNHEQMMYEAFHGGKMGDYWIPNGGFWGASTLFAAKSFNTADRITPDDLQAELIDLVAEVADLPFLITVNHKSGKKFHILHAELPPVAVSDEDLSDPEKVQQLATISANGGDCFLWARYRFGPFMRQDLSNIALIEKQQANHIKLVDTTFSSQLSHIYSGHTIVKRPLTLIGQTNLDTCAYASDPNKWMALTCVCIDDGKFYQATPALFKGEVEPVVINT